MTQPTARELLDKLCLDRECGCPASDIAGRVEKVLALHKTDGSGQEEREGQCEGCGEDWPCPTVRTLNGEE